MKILTEAEAWNAFVEVAQRKGTSTEIREAVAKLRVAQLEAARPARRNP